jgi:hypothetical protein
VGVKVGAKDGAVGPADGRNVGSNVGNRGANLVGDGFAVGPRVGFCVGFPTGFFVGVDMIYLLTQVMMMFSSTVTTVSNVAGWTAPVVVLTAHLREVFFEWWGCKI